MIRIRHHARTEHADGLVLLARLNKQRKHFGSNHGVVVQDENIVRAILQRVSNADVIPFGIT